ncbi:MAG: phosphopentomutase [bacterium]
MNKFKRIIIYIMDGSGCGVQEDYSKYHEQESNTLKSVYENCADLKLPTLEKLGLKKILFNIEAPNPYCAGMCRTATAGNDTYSSVWEMVGVPFEKRFRSEKKGFEPEFLTEIEAKIGRPIICNEYIAGFKAMDKYFELHKKTKSPLLYFAQDGIVLLAAHEGVIHPAKLNIMGKKLSDLLKDKNVVRVITRPFIGTAGNFTRSQDRHDYIIVENSFSSSAFGNLWSNNINLINTEHIANILGNPEEAQIINGNFNNNELSLIAKKIIEDEKDQSVTLLCFQDFDTMGHKKDVKAFGEKLKDFDSFIAKIIDKMESTDLLLLTADHGCNPMIDMRGHTREHVPLMFYFKKNNDKIWLGTRQTLADIGQTVCNNYNLPEITNGLAIKEIFN